MTVQNKGSYFQKGNFQHSIIYPRSIFRYQPAVSGTMWSLLLKYTEVPCFVCSSFGEIERNRMINALWKFTLIIGDHLLIFQIPEFLFSVGFIKSIADTQGISRHADTSFDIKTGKMHPDFIPSLVIRKIEYQ